MGTLQQRRSLYVPKFMWASKYALRHSCMCAKLQQRWIKLDYGSNQT